MTFNADHPARQIPRLAGDLETDTSYGFQAQYDSITGIITLVSWSDEEDKHESFSLTRENFDRIAAALKES